MSGWGRGGDLRPIRCQACHVRDRGVDRCSSPVRWLRDRLTLKWAGRTLPSPSRPTLTSGDPLADTSPARRRAVLGVSPPARSIIELIRAGTLDAELAATLWLLIEGRVPALVAAAEPGSGRSTLLRALLDFVPPTVRQVELAGVDETFGWLPQATELGWERRHGQEPPPASTPRPPGLPPVRPDTAVLVVREFSERLPTATWGEAARLAIRATTIGFGLAGTITGDRLEDVLAALGRPPVGASDDELSRLGTVLILRCPDPARRRVVAAHYLRPTARDEHGHVQRLGPAVLATWDPVSDRFEHFGWAIAAGARRPSRAPSRRRRTRARATARVPRRTRHGRRRRCGSRPGRPGRLSTARAHCRSCRAIRRSATSRDDVPGGSRRRYPRGAAIRCPSHRGG